MLIKHKKRLFYAKKTSISFCFNRLIYKFALVNELTKQKEK